MFRASNVKNAFSAPIHTVPAVAYFACIGANYPNHAHCRRRRRRSRYRCHRATVFGNQMIFCRASLLACQFSATAFSSQRLVALLVLRTSRESGMMPGARVGAVVRKGAPDESDQSRLGGSEGYIIRCSLRIDTVEGSEYRTRREFSQKEFSLLTGVELLSHLIRRQLFPRNVHMNHPMFD